MERTWDRVNRKEVSSLAVPLGVAEAKKNLSAIIRESSESLKLFRVANHLRRDAVPAVVMGEEALRILLERTVCTPHWEKDEEQGLWSVYVPELDLFGQGATREEAMADLIEAALEYADLYLDDVPFYLKVGRREHYPYVLAVALAQGDPDALKKTLGL